MTFREAIRELVRDIATKKHIRIGKAIDIDADKCVCNVDVGNGAVLHNVKLKAVEGEKDKGLLIIPKENTMVCAAMLEGVEANWVIVQHSEIDSWQITTDSGSKVIVANDGKVYLNGDNCDGIVKVAELVKKLNAIEDDINKLKIAMSGWVTAPNDGGAALKAAAASWFGQQLATTQQSSIENDKVLHGE